MSDLRGQTWDQSRLYVASKIGKITPLERRIERLEQLGWKITAWAVTAGAIGGIAMNLWLSHQG